MQILAYVTRQAGRQRALPGQHWWYKAKAVGAAGGGPTSQEDQVERTQFKAKRALGGY